MKSLSKASSPVDGRAVLVAVPTLNEEGFIEACIRSLMTGDARLKNVSIVVADGGSTDRTTEIVRDLQAEFPKLRLMHNEKRLQSAAVNAVAAQADPEIEFIVRCDAHSVYPPDFVMQVADSLRHTGADSVVVPMDTVGDGCFQKANAWVSNTVLGSGGSAHKAGRKSKWVDHGHHAGFLIDTFKSIGGYDETFTHNEDAEYDHRVMLAGGKIYLNADIRIAYSPRATARKLARQYFSYGKGRARTLLKHKQRPKLRHFMPVLNLGGMAVALLGSPVFPVLLFYPALYLAVLAAASIAMAIAKRSPCGLLAGLASFVIHNAWAAGFLVQCLKSFPTLNNDEKLRQTCP